MARKALKNMTNKELENEVKALRRDLKQARYEQRLAENHAANIYDGSYLEKYKQAMMELGDRNEQYLAAEARIASLEGSGASDTLVAAIAGEAQQARAISGELRNIIVEALGG